MAAQRGPRTIVLRFNGTSREANRVLKAVVHTVELQDELVDWRTDFSPRSSGLEHYRRSDNDDLKAVI